MNNFKKYAPVLLVGLLLRIIIAGFTFHPDLKIVDFTSSIIFKEHSLNVYDFNKSLDQNDIRRKIYSSETPDDLPLQYWIHIPLDLFLRPLVNSDTENQFLLDIKPLLGSINLITFLIVIKLPLIIFDLTLGLILTSLVNETLKKKVFLFWILNPFTLWATSAIGQVDVLSTLFVMLALFFAQKQKSELSVLSLGIGAALKSFPFLLAPFFIFYVKGWSNRLKLTILTFIPWVITVLPYIGSSGFRSQALFAPQLDKILYSKIYLSGGEEVFINIVILLVLYFIYLAKTKSYDHLFSFSFISLLLILAFTHFHIQWFIWVTPFLIIYLVKSFSSAQKLATLGLSFSVVGMLFLFDSSLQVGLFSPLIPSLYQVKGLAEILNSSQVEFFRSIFATVFAASSIYLAKTFLLE